VYSNFQLANSEDEVVLADLVGSAIDSVAYSQGWPLEEGSSMELVSPGSDNSDPASWGSSQAVFGLGDRGTPDQLNSISNVGIRGKENNRELPEPGRISMSVSPYPNPTSGSVHVSVYLSDSDYQGTYELGIYDVRGKLIRKISSCCLKNGRNTLIWEGYTRWGQKAPAGAYLLTLRSGNRTTTSKVVLYR
jgi:hypothetical protein